MNLHARIGEARGHRVCKDAGNPQAQMLCLESCTTSSHVLPGVSPLGRHYSSQNISLNCSRCPRISAQAVSIALSAVGTCASPWESPPARRNQVSRQSAREAAVATCCRGCTTKGQSKGQRAESPPQGSQRAQSSSVLIKLRIFPGL